jgi:hypothetical protein
METIFIVVIAVSSLLYLRWQVNRTNIEIPAEAGRVNTPEEIATLALHPDYGFLNERYEL